MKQFAGTLATVVLLGGLAGYYFLVDVPQEEKQTQETRDSARVLPYLLDQVHRFTYTIGDLTIEAVKEGLTWKLKKPVEALGDHMLLNGMLQQLEEIQHKRVVEESPNDLTQYGLQPPAISITLEEKNFGKKTVNIGASTPIGHSSYFKVDDNSRVVLVPGFSKDWAKTLYDFRSKVLLNFPEKEITSVTLERPKNSLVMKKEADRWRLTKPIDALGDSAAIDNLIKQIRHTRAQAFVDEAPSELDSFGLKQPGHIARFASSEKTWELALGFTREDSSINAKLKSKPNVVAVESQVKAAIETNYLDLIDKRVLTFKENEILQIKIAGQNETVTLAREESEEATWNVTTPVKTKADQAAVNSLLFDLKDTRALAFITFGEKENFGLKTPKQSLTLQKKNGDTQTLHLGNSNLDGKQFFLSRSLDGGVFVLETEKVQKLFRTFQDLRDRQLISVESEKAKSIVLKYPEKTFELERSPTGWTLIKPEKIENLRPFIGNDILWTLNSLQFENKSSSTAGSPETGFDSPALTVSVSDGQKNELAKVVVGKSVEGTTLRWAKTDNPAQKVQIKNRFLNEIPGTLEKFKLAKKQ